MRHAHVQVHTVPMLVPTGAAGMVLGWRAVFQVAAFGYAVVATVGEVVAYGAPPGTI